MNINDMIAQEQRAIDAAKKRRDLAKSDIKSTLDEIEKSGRMAANAAEETHMRGLFADIESAKADLGRHTRRLANALAVESEDGDLADAERNSRTVTAAADRQTAQFRIGNEPHTYSRQNDPAGTGKEFIADVGRAFLGDYAVRDKLSRHQHEMEVDQQRTAGDFVSGTGGVGFVVPQYLLDEVVPHVSNRRAFADAMTHRTLPAQGLTLEIPRVTTATSVAVQSSQLSAVSATSMVTDALAVSVLTAAGSQNVSRQALERTTVEPVLLQDLFAQYAQNLDAQLFRTATHGLHAVALAGTSKQQYTSSAPVQESVLNAILAGQAKVEGALDGDLADLVLMRSDRWNWVNLASTMEWPLINTNGMPVQASGVNSNAAKSAGFRGRLPNGTSVVVDNNIPHDLDASGVSGTGTNDGVYVVSTSQCYLWEEANAPVYLRAEQPLAANLGIQMVVYGYFAFTYERYANSASLLYGTGLSAPSFTITDPS